MYLLENIKYFFIDYILEPINNVLNTDFMDSYLD